MSVESHELRQQTHQEDYRNIESKSKERVGQQCSIADFVKVRHSDPRHLNEQSHGTIHQSADWSKVVERDQRVHLVLGTAQQILHHNELDGFKEDSSQLVKEADEDELDLAEGSDHDTDDDCRNVEQDFDVEGVDLEEPSDDQDSDRSCSLTALATLTTPGRRTHLQHLNERDAQVEVGQVPTHQGSAERRADWYNGTKVDTTSHFNSLAAIKEGRGARHDLRGHGREDQMPCRQDDWEAWRVSLTWPVKV